MDLRFLLLTVIAITYFGDANTCFAPDVSKLLKKVGDSVSLYCSSWNEHKAAVLKKDNHVITSGSNFIVEGVISSTEKVLRILNVTHVNEGSYTCTDADNHDSCTPVELKVYVLVHVGIGQQGSSNINNLIPRPGVCYNNISNEITFTDESTERLQYIQAGRTGRITCSSRSTPEPTNEWYVDGRKLPSRGDEVFQPEGKYLQVVSAAALNSSVFTCRANLKEFAYFKDLNITLSVPEGEPLSCLKCRHYDVGKGDSVDDCVSANNVGGQEQCHSSCVTITAAGPSLDGNIRYASIRGCGDHIGVFKEKCMELPHPVIKMKALSLFGDFSGLTNAEVCFCSSGDKCNNEAKKYKLPSRGVGLKGGTPAIVAAFCVIFLILIE